MAGFCRDGHNYEDDVYKDLSLEPHRGIIATVIAGMYKVSNILLI